MDEILKGTNTQDRISGSEALIRQILQTNGLGIISTHDIELSELEQSVEKVHNFSFHSEIQDQFIDFDYKIKKRPLPKLQCT
ncbi:MutS-related protein [Algoriphagus boritolerans]|uniref:MutS-related protein n=1 Tax=Algoriphagus boritolerans TaxID=308111 RepID=UPI000B2B1392